MRKYLLIAFYLIFSYHIVAQDFKFGDYQFPTDFPEKYQADLKADFKKIMASYKGWEKSISKPDFTRFANTMVYGKDYLFTSGQVYLNWRDFEEYLTQVYEKLLTDEQRTKISAKVYILRNPNWEAFSLEDGSVFISIGALALLDNESQVAWIIAENGACSLLGLQRKAFVEQVQNGKKAPNPNWEYLINDPPYSKKHVVSSDSMAIKLMQSGGYTLQYVWNTVYRGLHVNGNLNLKKEQKKNKKSGLAPNVDWMDLLIAGDAGYSAQFDFLKKYFKDPDPEAPVGTAEVISKEKFDELKWYSRLESVYVPLIRADYNVAIRNGFKFYLLDASDEVFAWYTMEAIRRQMLFDPKGKNKGLLFEDFSAYLSKGKGVLSNIRPFLQDPELLKMVMKKDLLDSNQTAFNTYDEAFKYFSELYKSSSNPEFLLTRGLSMSEKSQERQDLLTTYLNSDGVLFRDFAQNAFKRSLEKAFLEQTNDVLVFENPVVIKSAKSGYYVDYKSMGTTQRKKSEASGKKWKKKYPAMQWYCAADAAFTNFGQTMIYQDYLGLGKFMDPAFNDTVVTLTPTFKKDFTSAKIQARTKFELLTAAPELFNLFKDNELHALLLVRNCCVVGGGKLMETSYCPTLDKGKYISNRELVGSAPAFGKLNFFMAKLPFGHTGGKK